MACTGTARRGPLPTTRDERQYRLRFEGVYGVTRVSVDGAEVARNDSPYREFAAPLAGIAPGDTALIEVEVDNRAAPNSRWYTGSGIYRPVWLESRRPRRPSPRRCADRHPNRPHRRRPYRRDRRGDSPRSMAWWPSDATVVVEFEDDGQPVARRKAE